MLAVVYFTTFRLLVCCLKTKKKKNIKNLFLSLSWNFNSDVKEGHRLRMFVNMVLRRLCGQQWDHVTGRETELRKEELHNLHSSLSIIVLNTLRKMRWLANIVRMGVKRKL
jgi:hypothetical protein